MKLLVASDIHGSAYYGRMLIERIEEEKPDKILLLGDILYHGPRNALPDKYDTKEVISLLNPLKDKIICVRGNCDSEVDQMVLDFPIMADYVMLNVGNVSVFATHGHIYNCGNIPPFAKNSVLLHGHTHIPACEVKEDYIYMNPGSVSIPKNNSFHGYMVIDEIKACWKDVTNGQSTDMEYTWN